MPLAALADDISNFLGAVGDFFGRLAEIQLLPLVIGLTFFGLYLTIRSRAYFHVLRAAYPDEEIAFRRIWGAYIAAYGFNNVIPARGGDVIKLFLVKNSVPGLVVLRGGRVVLRRARLRRGHGRLHPRLRVHPGRVPQAARLRELERVRPVVLRRPPQFTLFLLTVLGAAGLVGFAVLSRRVRAFWARVRQGVTILRDRRRYVREVFAVQFGGWLCRCTAFWFLLDAFNIGGSVKNVLLVLGVNAVAAAVPFTPGGAGVQQALLVKVFAGVAAASTVAAYSVGQQIAIAAFSLGLGFVALVSIFRFRSFKDVIAAGRADREAERAAAQVA